MLSDTIMAKETKENKEVFDLSAVSVSVFKVRCCFEDQRSKKTQRKRAKIT